MQSKKGDLYTTEDRDYDETDEEISSKGGVSDMLVPIFSLIGCCVVGMLWSGGIFEGSDFVTAFSASDASVGLGVGSIFALLITLGYYMARRVVSFKEFMECIPKGFSSMIPPILILTFAWVYQGYDRQFRSKGIQLLLSSVVQLQNLLTSSL